MHINTFKLELGTSGVHQMVMITTEKVNHDINGNPIYLATTFISNREGNGQQWSPEFMGSRRKDGKLRIQSHRGHTAVAKEVFEKLQYEVNRN